MMSKIFALAFLVASTQACGTSFLYPNQPSAKQTNKESEAYKLKTAKKYLDVTTCMDGTDDVISDISLNVSPFPIDFTEGKKINLDGNFKLNTIIESGAKLHLKLKGVTIFGELTLPCIAVSIHYTYTLTNIYKFSTYC